MLEGGHLKMTVGIKIGDLEKQKAGLLRSPTSASRRQKSNAAGSGRFND